MEQQTRTSVKARRWLGTIVLAPMLAMVQVGARPAASGATTRSAENTIAPTVATGLASLAPLYPVTTRTEQFVDTARKVGANGSAPGRPQRPLPTLVIEPTPRTADQKFPLLVFGHGLGGEPAEYQELLTAVAARGYVVAAPTFPLTNKRAPGGANLLDEGNQPADMSFVIGAMLTSSSAGVIDAAKVAVAGHSLGAITVIDMIGNSCCHDRRVTAAITVAGSLNVFRAGKLFGSPATPVLFIHGDKDGTVPYALGYSTYQAAKSPKHFLTVLGGGHVFDLRGVPGSRATVAPLVADAMVRFLDAQLAGKGSAAVRASLRDEVKQNPKFLRYESVAR